jgi:putative RecB family exonuclease
MPIWSHSRISAYEQCPKRYYFRYIDKPAIERVDSIEAFLGSRVHDALERLYRDLRMHKPVSEVELLDEFEQDWQRHYHEDIRIVRRRYTAQHYYQVGRRCLADYFRRHAPFTEGRTLGLEERIVIDLDVQGEYRLQGYIDRLAQVADGHYEIHDYKTSNTLPQPGHFDRDRQLALYQIGVERRFGDARRVDLVWHYLQFDRELRSRREPEELDRLRYETIATIQGIEAESRRGRFPTRESALCDWCEFFSVCPAKKHLHEVQDLPPDRYRSHTGVQLVEEWVRLKEERGLFVERADAELERLEEAIVRYATEHDMEVLVGLEHKLRVKVRHGLKVPTKSQDPVALEALKEKLRGLGLWDRVVTLDRHALTRLIEGDELSYRERALLEAELVPDSGAQLYLSRLKERERTPGDE